VTLRAWLAGALIALPFFAATPTFAAEALREIHGMGDAYAGEGVALAWAVLRGADEAATLVVFRIVADRDRYPLVGAMSRNPFSQATRPLLSAIRSAGEVEVRVARAQFSDYPRTEFRFYVSASAAQADEPRLIIYYLGVPDTTPEFATEANLAAYLADRMARLTAGASAKP
jgi:hypothetical protein